MFKSLFAKYVTTFMAIILASFLVIILIISSIIGNYSEEAKTEIMERAAATATDYLEKKLSESEGGDLPELIESDGSDIESMLLALSSHSDDLTVLLVDGDGKVLSSVGSDDEEVSVGALLPRGLIAETGEGRFISEEAEGYGLFRNPHSLYGRAVTPEGGESEGVILICASSAMLTELRGGIVKTIVMTSLMVLLAALIAIYLISEKVIGPLKEISKAAKSFASGNFEVRVPVKGRDEVAELAVAFNNMAESLNNYDTMRNTFMSNVSHDLRTPMTSISGFIDGILDGVIPPEKHHYYLELVSAEVKRLSRLVTTLLDISRIQAGERKFTMTTFDVCEMGRQILISFEQQLTEKCLNVSFLSDEDKLLVTADRDAIYQVFYNLCDNGVKFAAQGGEFRIEIRRQKNRKVQISVYNEGQGISEADLPYVFERFYKSDKSRGLNKSGVGLGLFIAKTIVEAHREKIWAESEYGRDCCFNFTLMGE